MIFINSSSAAIDFVTNHDVFLLDCDGVIWIGHKTPIHGSIEALLYLHSLGKKLLFVSNNSIYSRSDFLGIFHNFGLNFVTVDDIFIATGSVAQYVKGLTLKHNKVFAIGSQGLMDELELQEISFCNLDHFTLNDIPEKVDAVIIGLDFQLTFDKLCAANIYLSKTDEDSGKFIAEFITTNMDNTFISESGPWLGTGSISSALIYSSGRIPTMIGKPSLILLDCIKEKHSIDPFRTCMIGDRLTSDIQFGKLGGLNTLLVFTGFATKKELNNTEPENIPTYTCQSIGHLVELAKNKNE